MRLFTHLIGTALGTLFRAFGTAILTAVIGGGAALLVSHQVNPAWPPSTLDEITIGVIAALSAYAGATTVLLRAITNTVVGATKAVEQDVSAVVK